MSEYIEHDLSHPGAGIVEKKFLTFAVPPEPPLLLESGEKLGPFTLAYETIGRLNEKADNAILVLHALSGDSHVAGVYSEEDSKPGWWDIMVGPGKAIDTSRYFVICSNVLGGCSGSTGPSSMDAATGRPYGLRFPMVTIGDMVQAQRMLIKRLGIRRLLAVIGGSMGGMQAMTWAIRYPDMAAAAIPLATTARHSALNIAFNEIARQAILADPNWRNGDYYGGPKPELGLAVARMIGHVTYLSDQAMRDKFGRRLQDRETLSFDFGINFQVESYLRHQGRKFVERFDANSFLYLTRATDYFDLAEQYGEGSIAMAMSGIKSRCLMVSFSSDWLYPTDMAREMVQAMKKNGLSASFCEINADCGHDAFLLPSERLNTLLAGFLENVHQSLAEQG